jgi:hypothetical protein
VHEDAVDGVRHRGGRLWIMGDMWEVGGRGRLEACEVRCEATSRWQGDVDVEGELKS